jgi:hypothetical protein
MLGLMKRQTISRIGQPMLKLWGVAVGLVFALLSTLRDIIESADTTDEEESDISAGAYRGGTLNYRTGRLDDGTDPYGWYGKD